MFATDDLRERFDRDGFALLANVLDDETIRSLHQSFEALFRGHFETGIEPDEVNWQFDTGDPTLTRQICNGWKANAAVAEVVRAPALGEAIARLGGWNGARLIQDNLLWKPPGARPLGFHCDNAYSRWYTPTEMLTCWIALDQTTADGGTLEFVRGSHRWEQQDRPLAEFHGPADYRAPIENHQAEIVPVELGAGGCSFHHGWTWHGSGPNRTATDRRALVIHAAPVEARFDRRHLAEGMGTVYGQYCGDDDAMPDEHFPILWQGSQA